MTPEEISSKKKWAEAHFNLYKSLENEIHLMREILASLHKEELTLLENNLPSWTSVMSERSEIIMQIKDRRAQRMDATYELTKIAVLEQKSEILPVEDQSSCEILSKLDQVIALSERINLQNCRNDALFDQARQKQELPLRCAIPHPLHIKKRRKTSVATDFKKN